MEGNMKEEHLDTKQKLLVCPAQCQIKLKNNKSRKQHVKYCHSKTMCHYCFFESKDEITIKNHIKFNHTSFKCKECGRAFNTRCSLSSHYGHYHPVGADKLREELNNNNKCEICGEQFKSSRRRTEHILSVHGNKWYPCNICGAKFNRKDSWEGHVQGVHGSKQKCKMCDFEGYKDELRKHKLSHVGFKVKSEDSDFRYSCLKCGKTYARQFDLMYHDQRIHKGLIFPCNQCNLNFVEKKGLIKHIRGIHAKTMCYICNFQLSEEDEDQIKLHIEKCHSTFKCGECGHISTTNSHLSMHMRLYHVEGRAKLKKQVKNCAECEESFMDGSSLKQHKLSVHLDLYKCPFCDKKMFNKKALKTHEYMVHLKKQCKEKDCDFKGSESELETHTQKLHMLQCEFCEFFTKTSNKEELRNHIGKKHCFPCNLCSFVAKYKVALKEHKISHGKDKVECNICGIEMSVSRMEVHILKCKIEQCSKCDFKGSPKQIRNHSQTHILNCKSCDFKTQDSEVLDKHFRRHVQQAKKKALKDSLYKCLLCDYKSTEKYFINMHLKNIHKSSEKCKDIDRRENIPLTVENTQTTDNSLQTEENYLPSEENFLPPEENSLQTQTNSLQTEDNFLPIEENFLPMDENCIPTEENSKTNYVDYTKERDIRKQDVTDKGGEKSTKENDKILSMMGTLQNAKWTCQSRNLQIFPVNQKVDEQTNKFKGRMMDISKVDSSIQKMPPIRKKYSQQDNVTCHVDKIKRIDLTFEDIFNPVNQASSTGVAVDDESQSPDDNTPTEMECSDCGFSTDDEELYHHHQVTDHLLCYLCGFTSEYQKFIFSHMKAIHNILDFEEEEREENPQYNRNRNDRSFRKKPTVCPICSHKSESKTENEKHHLDVHKNQTFQCSRCGSRAARFKTILKHYQSFHDNEITSKIVYDECAMK